MDAQVVQAVSAVLTAATTIALAFITWNYARHTKVMSEAMARQIVPDIRIEGASVELYHNPAATNKIVFSVSCDFCAWVRNENSASGSIVEPEIIAILDNGKEIRTAVEEKGFSILELPGGALRHVHLRPRFLFIPGGPDYADKTKRLLSPTTRFRVSCMDNLGIDRGKGVPVAIVNRDSSKSS